MPTRLRHGLKPLPLSMATLPPLAHRALVRESGPRTFSPTVTKSKAALLDGRLSLRARASFHTGLSKVGLLGADLGFRPEDLTIAELLTSLRDRPIREEPFRRQR